MPEQIKFDQDINFADRIIELEEQINSLETERNNALDNIAVASKKKKKQTKQEDIFMELPDNPKTREIDLVEDVRDKFFFQYTDSQGNKINATIGDLISDIEWCNYYNLNHQIKSQGRQVNYSNARKQYLNAVYQAKIDKFKTEKIIIQRLKIDRIDLDDHYLGQIYQQLYDDLKQGRSSEQAGFIFEKMIIGLLTKVSEDLGEKWGIAVAKAAVLVDVEFKTDIILKFLKSERGGRAVVARENEKTKGFQLTLIDKDNSKWQRKKEQVLKIRERIKRGEISEIDDLVLLETEVGNKDVMSRYEQWQKRGQVVGGPENLFKVSKIMEFLSKIFEETDLDFKNNPDFANDLNQYFEKK